MIFLCGVFCRKLICSKYGFCIFLMVFCFFLIFVVIVFSLIGLFLNDWIIVWSNFWLMVFNFFGFIWSKVSVFFVSFFVIVLFFWICVKLCICFNKWLVICGVFFECLVILCVLRLLIFVFNIFEVLSIIFVNCFFV